MRTAPREAGEEGITGGLLCQIEVLPGEAHAFPVDGAPDRAGVTEADLFKNAPGRRVVLDDPRIQALESEIRECERDELPQCQTRYSPSSHFFTPEDSSRALPRSARERSNSSNSASRARLSSGVEYFGFVPKRWG
jgi:hypothetical protein